MPNSISSSVRWRSYSNNKKYFKIMTKFTNKHTYGIQCSSTTGCVREQVYPVHFPSGPRCLRGSAPFRCAALPND